MIAQPFDIRPTRKVDVLEELQPYMEQFNQCRVTDGRLIACSPFREEQHPSFAVFLDTGRWVDSASWEAKSGDLYDLLAVLSGDSREGVWLALQSKYGLITDTDTLQLKLSLELKTDLSERIDLTAYMFRHPYLEKRGISEKVQRAFRVGYCKDSKAVTIPWLDITGEAVKLKFRTVAGKHFWYSKDGGRISHHLFGLYQLRKQHHQRVWVTEAEIDCMYLWTQGIPAVATGTANISQTQRKLLLQAGVTEVVIAADNDKAGQRYRQLLIERLAGQIALFDIQFSGGAKDMNDMTPDFLKSIIPTAIRVLAF